MRLKKFGALLLAGAMMTGTIGVMSPTQAKAATPANTYTMKVPANVDIQNSGWNSLGNIQITGSVDSGKKVTVTAATTNDFALKNGNNSVSYTLKKAENDTNATTSFEFDAASINAEGGASQAIGVDVADFAGKPAGNYTDTITFTGAISSSGGGSSDTPTASDMFVDGAQVEITIYTTFDQTHVIGFKYDKGSGYTCNKVFLNGSDLTSYFAQKYRATKEEQNFVIRFDSETLIVDTENNTYKKSSNIASLNALLINDTDIVASLSESVPN